MAAPLSYSSTAGSRNDWEKGDIEMRVVQQVLFAALISLTLTFSGGAVAQAEDWQGKKPPERPKERDKEEPKRDDKRDDKRDEGRKKPY